MQSEVFEVFREMGATEDCAIRAAEALARRDNEGSTIKADIALLKWMLSFVLALQVAFAFKLFELH